MNNTTRTGTTTALGLIVLLGACQPTVRIETPDKPIVINMNIHIKEEVRVKIDRDVQTLLEENDDLF